MNMTSNSMSETRSEVNAGTAAQGTATRPFYWCVQREIWENRSIYIAPLVAAGVIVFAFMVSTFVGIWEKPLRLDPSLPPEKLAEPYMFAALLLMGTTFIVAIFYCLDALYGERRDRSILFWKSLPVSDLTTVLSKASIPIVILPLVTFAITLATHWLMLLISTAILLVSSGGVAALWSKLPFFQMEGMLLYHLLGVHGFWYAPMYAWLLLVSAWARRAVFLWAALPLFAIYAVERIAFRTSHFLDLLGNRMGGANDAPFTVESMAMPLSHFHLVHFLVSPGLWGGVVFAAVCLAVTVRLRRSRGPI